MPRVTGPLFSAGASGAFGGIMEFRMVGTQAVVTAPKHRRKAPGPAQRANAARFQVAIGGWKTLDAASKTHWQGKALLLRLTGYQLYLREYLRQNIAPPHHPILPA
jgi:hypothetical protein